MGQLEIQDGFAPYFDSAKEIEVKTAASPAPPRYQRKPTASIAMPAALARKVEPPKTTATPARNRQME